MTAEVAAALLLGGPLPSPLLLQVDGRMLMMPPFATEGAEAETEGGEENEARAAAESAVLELMAGCCLGCMECLRMEAKDAGAEAAAAGGAGAAAGAVAVALLCCVMDDG